MTGIGRLAGDEKNEDCIPPSALYVHVPICASKCSYCDFFSTSMSAHGGEAEEKLVCATLDRATRLARRFGARSFDTVYVGGGTPTMLSPSALAGLLGGLRSIARGIPGINPQEWTVEANPDSLGPEALDIMAAAGVTRVSLGAQSLDPAELRLLGRRHDPERALSAIELAAGRGFTVSADLIAGIPVPKGAGLGTATPERLASFALALLNAGASHLSVYDLSLEEGTPLAAMASDLKFPSDDEAWESRRLLELALRKTGLRRYEVSNYSAPGRECLHNLAYWRMASYIGAGPGAVSTIELGNGASLRIEEPKRLEGYSVPGQGAAAETRIAKREAAFETIMMAFRTSFGLDLASFERRFGMAAEELIGSTLATWSPRLVQGEPWPKVSNKGRSSAGPALDSTGLDILNRFLVDCLEELESKPIT